MNRLSTLLAAALLAGAFGAQAAPIHKWVDDKGVTHYSDRPPQAETLPVTQLDVDTRLAGTTANPGQPNDYYSIANQWQRMSRERELREQRELQRTALSIEAQATREPERQYRETEKEYRAVIYPRRWHRRHGHKQPRYRTQGSMNIKHPPVRGLSSGFPSVVN